MKVYVISYYVEPGEAGVTGVFRGKKKAEKHFSALLRDAWSVEVDQGSRCKAEIKEMVKAALKDGFFDYPGDGCGPRPWYALNEEEVQ